MFDEKLLFSIIKMSKFNLLSIIISLKLSIIFNLKLSNIIKQDLLFL